MVPAKLGLGEACLLRCVQSLLPPRARQPWLTASLPSLCAASPSLRAARCYRRPRARGTQVSEMMKEAGLDSKGSIAVDEFIGVMLAAV